MPRKTEFKKPHSTLDVGRWMFDVHFWKNKYGRQVIKIYKKVTTLNQDLTYAAQ